MAFRFKQFSVEDSNCSMKVGTDSVLLGAWTDFNAASSILDIGTGCGILALIAAQKSNASITAIDIDKDACIQASENFKASPWPHRISCFNAGLQNYNSLPFDHIITNPPYFVNSLKSPKSGRNTARHTDELPPEILIERSSTLLADGGKLSVVFPYPESQNLISLAALNNLNLSRQLMVFPKEGKDPNRMLLEFTKGYTGNLSEDELSIRDSSGEYTSKYISITESFYLHLS